MDLCPIGGNHIGTVGGRSKAMLGQFFATLASYPGQFSFN